MPCNPEAVQLMISMFDKDGNGTINFGEFGHYGNYKNYSKPALNFISYRHFDRFYDILIKMFVVEMV